MAINPDGTILEVELMEEESTLQADADWVNEDQAFTTANSAAGKTAEEKVLEKGAGFLEGLLNILSNPESTQRFVNKITETDTTTGQTYLKLPIANIGMVQNALKLISGLFGGMGKK